MRKRERENKENTHGTGTDRSKNESGDEKNLTPSYPETFPLRKTDCFNDTQDIPVTSLHWTTLRGSTDLSWETVFDFWKQLKVNSNQTW